MSKFFVTFAILLSLFVTNSNISISEEKSHKIGVIINQASWCPACQANGERVKTDVVSKYMKAKNLEIVVNDLSNKETIANSQKMLVKLGLDDFTEKNKITGSIYFVDLMTKKVINSISVTKSNDDLFKAFEKNIKH